MNEAEKKANIPISFFGHYIKHTREEKGITAEKLCNGICSYRHLLRIECGEQLPDFLLQDALLERLGIGEENYETYLDSSDYNRWLERMKILNSINYEKWDIAKQLLDLYQYTLDSKENYHLEKQFILSMQGLIKQQLSVNKTELYEIYQEAAKQTIPETPTNMITDLVLSIKELNILLERERYCPEGAHKEHYLEIMRYAETNFDNISIAKIYPKAVYLLCLCQETDSPKKLREYCEKALEYLRNTSRSYYLWEILQLRELFLDKQIASLKGNFIEAKEELEGKKAQNHLWTLALEEAYNEYHIKKETFEYTYLYVLKGANNISDVVKTRRKMLGLSREKMWETDPGNKTLKRLENKQVKPQWKTMVRAFSKLGLPAEYTRNTLITENHQFKNQMTQLKRLINVQKWEEADHLINEIKKILSNEDTHNMQVLIQKEALIKWHLGEIDKKEYYQQLLDALQLTISLESFLQAGQKYLTHQEQTCIINLMKAMDKNHPHFLTCLKRFEEYYRPYEENGLLQSVEGMYVLVIGYISSELGNMGNFVQANYYNAIITERYLRSRKLRVLPLAFYDRLWNNKKCFELGISTENKLDEIKEFNKIIQLANLDKQEKREQIYRQKLQALLN